MSKTEPRLDELNNKEKKTFIVLGMHRSGTSAVAHALHESGISMGTTESLLGENNWNPYGHYENTAFNTVNQNILKDAGGDWQRPPSHENILKQEEKYRPDMQKCIEEYSGDFWGWKDPRTALTAPLWLSNLDGDVYLVCVFRRPVNVVSSLIKRSLVDLGEAVNLNKEYNRRIINTIRDFTGVDRDSV